MHGTAALTRRMLSQLIIFNAENVMENVTENVMENVTISNHIELNLRAFSNNT